jgi:hypothetical protein
MKWNCGRRHKRRRVRNGTDYKMEITVYEDVTSCNLLHGTSTSEEIAASIFRV